MRGGLESWYGNFRGYSPTFPSVTIVALTLAACFCWSGPAEALYILGIRGFSQSSGVSYSFLRSATSEGSRESEHDFTEDYGLSFNYSMLSPQLLRGDALLDLEWLQKAAVSDGKSRSSSDLHLRYNVGAQLLSRMPYPVTVSASSTRETVSQSFAPSYDNNTDDLALHLALKNLFLPLEVTLDRQTQETSGVNQNYRQNANSYSVSAKPQLKIASLSLGIVGTQSSSTALGSNVTSNASTTSANAGSQRSWYSEGLSRALSLSYNWQGTQGSTVLYSQDLNGGLTWQLGKALDGSLQYSRGSSRSSLFTSQNQGGNCALIHRLGASLTTNLGLSAAEFDYNGGANRAYGAGLGFAYRKLLPESKSLSLSYTTRLGWNERTGEVSVVDVLNEKYLIPTALPRTIVLANPTFDPESIQVSGAQTLLPYPASNFTVVPEGIEIRSFFAGDSAVLVSYSFRQDPSVTTSTLSHAVSSSLTFHQGKYRVYADAAESSQHQVKGTATLLSLTATLHYDAGMTAGIAGHTLGAEAGYDKNFTEDLYYLNTSWGHTAPFAMGQLTLNAVDRYTWQSQSQGGRQGGVWANSVNIQSEYRRALGPLAGRLKLDYANTLVQSAGATNTALFSLNLEGKLGRLFTLLYCSSTWSMNDRGNTSSQGVGFSIRRTF